VVPRCIAIARVKDANACRCDVSCSPVARRWGEWGYTGLCINNIVRRPLCCLLSLFITYLNMLGPNIHVVINLGLLFWIINEDYEHSC
jgi:hypothetical protein